MVPGLPPVRRGVLVRVIDAQGRTGWGDAAPLPGWSVETLAEACEDIRQQSPRFPSARFALGCAFAEATGWADFTPRMMCVPVNALLSGHREAVLEKARLSIDAGCRFLKVKIHSRPVSEIVWLARELAALHPDVTLRLDANRSLDFDAAASLWRQTCDLPIEYFEEPLHDSSRLPELIQKTGAPVALDETLRQITPDELFVFRGARALVLKPTFLGSPSECVHWAEAGATFKMRSVVSAAYESGVGIHALARIAAALPEPSAAGLDTYSALLEDTLATRLDLSQWVVDITQPRPPLREDFAKCAQ